MHYIIVIAIIAVILILQVKTFFSTNTRLSVFKDIFGETKNVYFLKNKETIRRIEEANDDELVHMITNAGFEINDFNSVDQDFDGYYDITFLSEKAKSKLIAKYKDIGGITTTHENPILNTIFTSINDYLSNNKGKDFHLMKDIVDRNCDAIEEEIQTQIPVPLYLGLVGTMAGILVGVGYLVFTGGLNELLNSNTTASNGVKGVEALMGGIAIAMLASIVGILLTTLGADNAKTAKASIEKNKNVFLSWIQAELLPTMSDSISDAMERMTIRLTEFNDTFASNTSNLGIALSKVNESYHLQTQIINAVKQIQDKDVTTNNIKLLTKLIECSDQIGTLGTYLQNTNGYLENVRALNSKLDEYEGRTQVIENAGKFYSKNERWLSENLDSANLEVKGALGRFHETVETSFKKLSESMDSQVIGINNSMLKQQTSIEKAFEQQQEVLQGKFKETTKLLVELENLTAVKNSMKNLEKATSDQNKKIEKLADAINKLAEVKVGDRSQTPTWLIATSIGVALVAIVPMTTIIYLIYKLLIS